MANQKDELLHTINNKLGIITGQASLLKEHRDKDVAEAGSEIQRAAEEVANLVRTVAVLPGRPAGSW